MSDSDIMAQSYAGDQRYTLDNTASPTSYDLIMNQQDISPSAMAIASSNSQLKPECRFCGKQFSQFGYVKAHERIHTGEKPYMCGHCGKRFTDQSNWKKHERMHARQMQYVSTKGPLLGGSSDETPEKKPCISPIDASYKFAPIAMKEEPIYVTNESNGTFDCDICTKSYNSPYHLALHRSLHKNQTPFECKVCGKVFTQAGHLKVHERSHDPQMYICHVCGKKFSLPGVYRMHEQRHFTQDQQTCNFCSATFSTWQTLHQHVLSHHKNISLPKNLLPGGADFVFSAKTEDGDQMPISDLEVMGDGSNGTDVSVEVNDVDMASRNGNGIMLFEDDNEESDSLESNTDSDGVRLQNRTQSSEITQSYNISTVVDLSEGGSSQSENEIVSTTEQEKMSLLADMRETNGDDEPTDLSINGENLENYNAGISHRNLHSRLLSTNPRKQKHPMKICSVGPTFDTAVNSGINSLESKLNGVSEEDVINYLVARGAIYKCDHCDIIFKDCTLYLLHNGFHMHDLDPFKCVICRDSFSNKFDFNCHLTSHIK